MIAARPSRSATLALVLVAFAVAAPGGAESRAVPPAAAAAEVSTIAVAVAGDVAARRISIDAEADTALDAGAPAAWFGGASSVTLAGSPERALLLRFDLRATGPVDAPTLRLHPSVAMASGSQVLLEVAWLSDDAWSEGQVTAAAQPARDGAFVPRVGVVAADGWIEVDLTGAVAGGDLLTLLVRLAVAPGSPAPVAIDTRDSGATGPKLVLGIGATKNPSTSLRIWATGDISCPPANPVTVDECHQWAVSNLVVADPATDAFIPLGDLQYPAGSLADLQGGYGPSFGRLLPITLPAVGNHEYVTPGAAGYAAYFGTAAHMDTGGYYSVDLGSTWHVVVLNSNCSFVSCSAGSAQEQWLRADLAASTRPCTIGVWHHPRFTSGPRYSVLADVAPLWRALADDGAEIVLNGHEHVYERFHRQTIGGVADPAGIRELIVGTGGRSQYTFTSSPLVTSAVRLITFGALRLDLDAAGYRWSFVDEHGVVQDSGSGVCT